MALRETLIRALAALALLDAAASAQQEPVVGWNGEEHPASALPAELPGPARQAIEAWVPWAGPAGYRMDLEPSGRVLLLTRADFPRRDASLGLAERVLSMFEAKLPPPTARIEAEPEHPDEPAPPSSGEAPLPEDPEDGGHPWDDVPWGVDPGPGRTEYVPYTWGAGGVPPDTETIVFLIARDQTEYESALAFLAGLHDYLSPWLPEARKQLGFTLQEPLAGAYIEQPPGVEEWHPDHELVNRLAQLLLLRRFGQEPYWLVNGWAWTVEIGLLGSVYCFPYRDEFVWATEHASWPAALKELFEERARKPLRVEEFAGWKRGTYVDVAAKLSWGVVDYLVREHDDELPDLLEALRAYRAEHDREVIGETTWKHRRDYEIPVPEQERILDEHLGKGTWARMTRAFRGR